MQTAKVSLRSLFLIVATFFCATSVSYAQDVGPTIQPTTTAQKLPDFNPDANVTMGGEYKSTKNVVTEQAPPEKWWSVNAQVGYSSEYIFRGTNLTPNSDGIEFQQVYVSAKGFTLGFWFGTQLGHAVVHGATALGESGSGGGGNITPPQTGFFDFSQESTAFQTKFHELDLFLSYSHSFGPIDVTIGNIAFLIYRNAVDQVTQTFSFADPDFGTFTDVFRFTQPVPENEKFDRLYLSVSTSMIHFGRVTITPTVTYYQTIYNDVDDIKDINTTATDTFTFSGPFGSGGGTSTFSFPTGPRTSGLTDEQYTQQVLGFKRNDQLGGYLEGKVQAVIPIIGDVLRLEPTALISYSFKDRSESVAVPPPPADNPFAPPTVSSSRPLTGFNHVQAGAELVLQLTRHVALTGFGDYAYHIANPPAGTERNEWWGGGKVVVTF